MSQPLKALSQDDRVRIERGRRRLLHLLLALLALPVAVLVLAALAPSGRPSPEWLTTAMLALIAVFVVVSWWVVFATGALARHVGRSPIVWGGLGLLFAGLGGSLIAAILIRRHAAAALTSGYVPERA